MKTWIMTAFLGGLLLSGTWANARQDDPPAAPIAVQSGTVDDQSGPVTASGGGVVVGADPAGADGLPAEKRVITVQRIGPPPPTVAAPVPMPIPNIGKPFPDRPGQVWISSARATMAGKAEKTAYLGVVTTRATATLRSQLKLKAGLVVESIEPKSSAEIGGLQVHDIIEKCDDQWLINPAQFIGLVRMYYKPGETVTLTVLREGERKKITAKLDERETYAMDDDGNAFYGSTDGGTFHPNSPQGPVPAFMFGGGGGGGSAGGPVQRIAAGALGKVPLTSGFMATFGDDKQQLLITIRDGHQIVTARDSGGKQIFEGPIDTPEQRAKLPPAVRKQLDAMERIRVKIRTPAEGFDYDPKPPR